MTNNWGFRPFEKEKGFIDTIKTLLRGIVLAAKGSELKLKWKVIMTR